MKLVCENCNGTEIETKAWIDPNDNTVLDGCSDGDEEDNWCRKCKKHVYFRIIEDDKLQLKLDL